jgi:hypothetical protein
MCHNLLANRVLININLKTPQENIYGMQNFAPDVIYHVTGGGEGGGSLQNVLNNTVLTNATRSGMQ